MYTLNTAIRKQYLLNICHEVVIIVRSRLWHRVRVRGSWGNYWIWINGCRTLWWNVETPSNWCSIEGIWLVGLKSLWKWEVNNGKVSIKTYFEFLPKHQRWIYNSFQQKRKQSISGRRRLVIRESTNWEFSQKILDLALEIFFWNFAEAKQTPTTTFPHIASSKFCDGLSNADSVSNWTGQAKLHNIQIYAGRY